MQLDKLLASLEQVKHAPTELWDPPDCGTVPIHINERGEWSYQNSPIRREKLVRLLASVLVKEGDDYFLVTPVEKMQITVADAPFLITQWRWHGDAKPPVMQLTTNIGDEFPLSEQHPLIVKNGVPYVDVGRDLLARVHRNVYYQWVESLFEQALQLDENGQLTLTSAGKSFKLGKVD
ncbi:hypothetical protein SAMN06297229_2304 [Pseudidiomarina planktonica]|uniref:DUF1285 domain-containing protein n=1 Tax=Pseudidiomarina planktonica TaxID=1323738 RepID=A0A1Y6FZN9_9GAMM|nr:DUF1285 domain-containing protein [Pseudidiomarina planktonica]RUO63239.1 DUF1285 domain-containing protein [Pseudidiomarina planktonica]SMQ80548.1 hypothetical protein SAMN06297229_2304 [Pseudidiomarina planktonica]